MEIGKALGRHIPFASLLGVRLVEHGDGRAVIEVDLAPELHNSFGSAHGGVIMTLLDIAMAVAARTTDPKAVGAITVEMKASFIGTCTGRLIAEGRCLHTGKSVSFCEGEARDADGRLVARASGTFMVRRATGGQDDTLPQKP
ncbi:MAG TPA: PaaI family thioesterase [Usitatibacter sp.]|nr:PaaI family thioesterase [Usitatibacter sp.]